MSVTVHPTARGWASAHRALLAVVVLVMALGLAAGLTATRLAAGSAPVPTTPSVSGVPLSATDDGCLSAGPGQAC